MRLDASSHEREATLGGGAHRGPLSAAQLTPCVRTTMRDVRLEQADSSDWAIDSSALWREPSAFVLHLRDNTNHVAAASLIEWSEFCPEDARVLDLGSGSGWLTAMLSREPSVRRVIAWDSSRRSVDEILPVAMEIMQGEWSK